MTSTGKFLPTERTLDDWHNGQITLPDAHDKLVRLGHDPETASDMLRDHDPKRFSAQHSHYNGYRMPDEDAPITQLATLLTEIELEIMQEEGIEKTVAAIAANEEEGPVSEAQRHMEVGP
jgi:hypothetical protein